MCLAVPGRVIRIKKDWATLETNRGGRRVNLCLVKNIKIGDYLLFHGEMALSKISKKEAGKILKIIS